MGVVGQVTVVAGNALNDEDLEKVVAPADAVVNLIGIAEAARSGSTRFRTSFPGALASLPSSMGWKMSFMSRRLARTQNRPALMRAAKGLARPHFRPPFRMR